MTTLKLTSNNRVLSVRSFDIHFIQMSPVVRAVYQAQLREGVDEIRYADRFGTAPVFGNVGNDQDPEVGLSGAHEV